MALAAKPKHVAGMAYVRDISEEAQDEDTDKSYKYANDFPPPLEAPFFEPHMMARVEVRGSSFLSPAVTVDVILDNGCPSTVISLKLAQQLGLKQFPLPAEEDNLTSLSKSPLTCKEFVQLEVVSGRGAWRSWEFRAKVNTSLPVPLLLGMPFLSTEYVVLDLRAQTAINKRTGYNLANPNAHRASAVQSDSNQAISVPPPEDYESAERIMAMVRKQIEVLSLEEQLSQKDTMAKATY
ncbi:hypothetical protein C0995_009936, partial [Termitomyces sp. Mi166